MPPLPPVAGVLKCEFIGNYDGASWANILHVDYAGTAPTDAQCVTIANDLANAFTANLLTRTRTNNHLTEVIVTDLTSATAGKGSATGALGSGSAANAAMPGNVAVCISWKIHRRYRGGHPRTYMCGITNTGQASNVNMTDAEVAAWLAKASQFITDVNALVVAPVSPFILGTVSYRTGNAPRVAPIFENYTDAFIHHRYDSQRRRLGKEPLT